MKRSAIALTILAGLCAASTQAAASEALAKAKNCLACHTVASKLVGPSYKEIAAKYSAKDVDTLADCIKKGSKGKWGAVPMPPNRRVSDEEAKKLAAWILGLK